MVAIEIGNKGHTHKPQILSMDPGSSRHFIAHIEKIGGAKMAFLDFHFHVHRITPFQVLY